MPLIHLTLMPIGDDPRPLAIRVRRLLKDLLRIYGYRAVDVSWDDARDGDEPDADRVPNGGTAGTSPTPGAGAAGTG